MIDRLRSNWKVLSCVAAGLAFLFAANAHLVFVAFDSQPECVAHSKIGSGTDNKFSAAKPAC